MPISPPQAEAPAAGSTTGGLLLAFGCELAGQPALGVPGLDLADFADRAVLAELQREHNQREAV